MESGDVLGRLGNSGNSDAPHLHFQLTDGDSPLGSEGVPYALERFSRLGLVKDPDALVRGEAWPGALQPPALRQREFPIDDEVVAFPSR